MPRDRRLTGRKLARAEGALRDLLDCDDLEYRTHVERALRAVEQNTRWHAAEVARGAEDGDEPLPALPAAPDVARPA